jgi:GntR family transcriptional regulator/MocR family aminotransferase
MLMPGLRVGFLVAEGPVFDGLVRLKHASDLSTSSLVQRALEAYVTVGRYQAHLRRTCQMFRRRRDAMTFAIKRYLPAGVHSDPPQGGLFHWVQLPDGMSADELLPLACAQGVNFAPGSGFFPDAARGADWMRLNFAAQPPEEIEEGIRRLAKAIRAHGSRSRAAPRSTARP